MQTQWVAQSLTVWGVIVAVLTALVPAVAAMFPDLANTLTPEWIAGIDATVKNVITSLGVIVGSVMIIYDRISGNAAKTLVLRRE